MKTFKSRYKQKGFTLIELMIVVVFIGVLGALLMPRIGNYIVKLKVPGVANDLNSYASIKKGTAQLAEGDPYTGLTQASFARQMRKTNLSVNAGSEVVQHNLGGVRGGAGTVTIFETGTQFGYNLTGLAFGACPALLTQMENNAWRVTLNGRTLKQTDDSGNISTPYNTNTAEGACVEGDTNEAVVTYN